MGTGGGVWRFFFQANLRQAVGDEFEVVLHHHGVHAQYVARDGIASVFDSSWVPGACELP